MLKGTEEIHKHREPSQISYHQSRDSAKEHHDAPFMDKQNEGIKDPEVKEIPYDMGG